MGSTGSTPYTTPFANTPAQAVTTANAAWYRGGNFNTGPAGNSNVFGTLWNSDIWITTNKRYIAKFSTNNGLNGTGDGLRINNMTPSAPVGLGEIDIFTKGSNGTEIRFGGSGNI